MNYTSIPYISITPNSIAWYSHADRYRRTKNRRVNEVNLQDNAHNGKISQKARRRITKGIDYMLFMAKEKQLYPSRKDCRIHFKLNMVTLTLSSTQIHTDNEIKSKLLHQFLVEARNKWKCEYYLWRAESQANGNIHFHIITDKFIPWNELRNCWNRIQNKLGYVDRFNEKWKGRTPNSTDIHSIWKVKNLSAYLAKYCTKEDKNREIQGKQWGLSSCLSKFKSSVHVRYNELEEAVWRIRKGWKDRLKVYEYATVLYVHVEEWRKVGGGLLVDLLTSYCAELAHPTGSLGQNPLESG
jgi:hypothetical protein